MERLTKTFDGLCVGDNTVAYIGQHKQYDADIPIEMSTAAVREVLKKLAAYEDTGLTPEEVAAAMKDGTYAQFQEWNRAHYEGRLVVLPCKVGDRVWSSVLTEIDDDGVEHVAPWSFVPGMMDEWGKSFFLTRAEAKKALKGVSEDA